MLRKKMSAGQSPFKTIKIAISVIFLGVESSQFILQRSNSNTTNNYNTNNYNYDK